MRQQPRQGTDNSTVCTHQLPVNEGLHPTLKVTEKQTNSHNSQNTVIAVVWGPPSIAQYVNVVEWVPVISSFSEFLVGHVVVICRSENENICKGMKVSTQHRPTLSFTLYLSGVCAIYLHALSESACVLAIRCIRCHCVAQVSRRRNIANQCITTA